MSGVARVAGPLMVLGESLLGAFGFPADSETLNFALSHNRDCNVLAVGRNRWWQSGVVALPRL